MSAVIGFLALFGLLAIIVLVVVTVWSLLNRSKEASIRTRLEVIAHDQHRRQITDSLQPAVPTLASAIEAMTKTELLDFMNGLAAIVRGFEVLDKDLRPTLFAQMEVAGHPLRNELKHDLYVLNAAQLRELLARLEVLMIPAR